MDYHGAMLDDEQTLLVRKAKANDAASFGQLVQLHASRAFAAAVAILGQVKVERFAAARRLMK
ncbi:MAG: hypothetical protein Q8P22_08350 [Chloroflexota bacterium]|nr:hypothetical protein [Chloroflexota bacterium]